MLAVWSAMALRTQLGSRAFDILCILISRQGEVVSKAELMEKAWPGLTVEESSLRFHIAQLRRVLGDGQDGELLCEECRRTGLLLRRTGGSCGIALKAHRPCR